MTLKSSFSVSSSNMRLNVVNMCWYNEWCNKRWNPGAICNFRGQIFRQNNRAMKLRKSEKICGTNRCRYYEEAARGWNETQTHAYAEFSADGTPTFRKITVAFSWKWEYNDLATREARMSQRTEKILTPSWVHRIKMWLRQVSRVRRGMNDGLKLGLTRADFAAS